MKSVPEIRIRRANQAGVRSGGEYVLYWMIAARRLSFNFALDRALSWARELGRPLLLLEPLRAGYPWASDRFHRFVLDGMAEHARRLAGSAVAYYPYVEPHPGAGSGLLAALATRAAVVVTDDSPAFFYPRMVAAAAARLDVRLEAVDGNGLLPIAATRQVYPTAYAFRRFLQKELPEHLGSLPRPRPLDGAPLQQLETLPAEIVRRFPPAAPELLSGDPAALARLPIDHSVAPVAAIPGGEEAGRKILRRFLDRRLHRYVEARTDLDDEATSGLSPYLHFGHLSAHEVFAALTEREGWTPERLAGDRRGAKEGFWGMSAAAESFLDELVTWREVGFNRAAHEPGYDRYATLPPWARQTLADHASDPRPHLYTLESFERAQTDDDLWNAAQGQLLSEGRIHNYLRMLWGKKVLHWTARPQEALEILVELNNKYALDGRDPNSYSGIFWCLGRFDRPWPERPVFGTVRYMSSESARKKLDVSGYLRRFAPGAQLRLV
ncbi:MAG TPA: deoxyribodipyrimidine photolyase [Thermoanaerobaculia bacterium]|nr:deoxyribodipyrimidine photolyase [Thermoanaerobaculia bacterium]